MKKEEMNKRIRDEIEHIPRADKGSPQNTFRMMYNIHRRRDLARQADAPASRTLIKAMVSVTREYPRFSPSFRSDFLKKVK